MKCENIIILLPAYQDKEVTPEERKQIEDHLKVCQLCREDLNKLASVSRDLRRVFVSKADEIAPSSDSWRKLRERLNRPSNHLVLNSPRRRPGRWRLPALVLTPLVVVLIVLLVLQPWNASSDLPTTRVAPQPGDIISRSMGLSHQFSLNEFVRSSDAIISGKVTEILPSREGIWAKQEVIYTDVVIEPLFYLYGETQARRIIIRVMGGKVGNRIMWSEDQPVFTLGEQSMLFLSHFPDGLWGSVPGGEDALNFYGVVAGDQGKFKYWWPGILTHNGWPTCTWLVKAKINSIHGK
jgi:hypothetical protein